VSSKEKHSSNRIIVWKRMNCLINIEICQIQALGRVLSFKSPWSMSSFFSFLLRKRTNFSPQENWRRKKKNSSLFLFQILWDFFFEL